MTDDGNYGDHQWPPDLSDDDARCEQCGLLYREWIIGDPECGR